MNIVQKRSFIMTFQKVFFFFFNDTATTEIYTLSLHDALPISSTRSSPTSGCCKRLRRIRSTRRRPPRRPRRPPVDRKSTRLNSSHLVISYAVFCLKKKNKNHLSCHFPYLCYTF